MIESDGQLINHLLRFIGILDSRGIDRPTITVEDDGCVGLEWYRSPSRVVNASMDPEGKIAWAVKHPRWGNRTGETRAGYEGSQDLTRAIEDVFKIGVGDWVGDKSSPRYEGVVVHRLNDLIIVRFNDLDDDGPVWLPVHHYEVDYIDHRPDMLLLKVTGVLRTYAGNYVCVSRDDGSVIAFGNNVAGVEQSGMNVGKPFDTWQVNSYATKVGSWAP